MQDLVDIASITERLMKTLGEIEAMLGDERTDEEKRQADYIDLLRRKATGEISGNVTAHFFA
ncbi:hypothetical protein [Aureimonas sp. Leaf324]|jgi:hypothetical protein|uniref:hypothetical protein n=1 Tax=Aureimonas sp. Leaf324 TaxID=1736336 RepID=UPI0006F8C39F|nr:hypothetical protein [Aureimonas sp. Leaf324]KQQ89898.1 hypothetical protein ASF65_16735 [Aureimonas sp. Leaf324]